MKSRKQFTFWLYILLSASIILVGFKLLFLNNWFSLGMSMLTLLFITLPFLIEKRFRLKFPRQFLSILLLFFYASMFLGTANHFFTRFWWWDKMLHSFSGLIFANLGFLIAMYLGRNQELDSKFNRTLVVLFSFCFSVASGAVWEIYEYSMDEAFGFLYQGIGIDDTMLDIICDTLGALLFALVAFFQGNKRFELISKVDKFQ